MDLEDIFTPLEGLLQKEGSSSPLKLRPLQREQRTFASKRRSGGPLLGLRLDRQPSLELEKKLRRNRRQKQEGREAEEEQKKKRKKRAKKAQEQEEEDSERDSPERRKQKSFFDQLDEVQLEEVPK